MGTPRDMSENKGVRIQPQMLKNVQNMKTCGNRGNNCGGSKINGPRGRRILGHEYIAPELFLLLMTSLFTFYHFLLSAIIFAVIFCRFHVTGVVGRPLP